jgi:hypothetical protein
MKTPDSIAGLFIGERPPTRHVERPAAAESMGSRFAVISGATGEAGDAARCREAVANLAPGGHLAIALELSHGSRFHRTIKILTLPFRAAGVERELARSGADPVGRYGVAPDLATPTVVYQLGVAASRYAEERLLLTARSRPAAVVCAILRMWAGCDPSLGAILVVGRKQ